MYKKLLLMSSISSILLLSACSEKTEKIAENQGIEDFKYASSITYNNEQLTNWREFKKLIPFSEDVKQIKQLSTLDDFITEKDNKIIEMYTTNVIAYSKEIIKDKEKTYIENYIKEEETFYKSLNKKYTKEMKTNSENKLYFTFGFNSLLDKTYPISENLNDFKADKEGYLVLSKVINNDSEAKNKKEVDKTKELLKKIKTIDKKSDFDLINKNNLTVSIESTMNSYTDEESLKDYKKMQVGDLRTSKLNVTDYKVEKVIKIDDLSKEIQKNYLQRNQFSLDIQKMSDENVVIILFKMLDSQYEGLNLTHKAYELLGKQVQKDSESELIYTQYNALRNLSILTQKVTFTDFDSVFDKK